jgi:hypothetical protein
LKFKKVQKKNSLKLKKKYDNIISFTDTSTPKIMEEVDEDDDSSSFSSNDSYKDNL